MSNIFRDSESLGKSNGKKWSNIWTFVFGSGLKSPHKKKFFFADSALQNMVETTLHDGLLGFWVFLVHPPMASVLWSASVKRCFVSRMRDFLKTVLYCFGPYWLFLTVFHTSARGSIVGRMQHFLMWIFLSHRPIFLGILNFHEMAYWAALCSPPEAPGPRWGSI